MADQHALALEFMQAALAEAQQGFDEGGIPIGSVLVVDGQIIGRGHNRRVQQGNPILHGEMDAFKNAGRQLATTYAHATLYSTLSPCPMCSGTSILYKIPRIVIGENRTVADTTLCEDWLLRARGIEVVVLDLPECYQLMQAFIARAPEVWNEDIGY